MKRIINHWTGGGGRANDTDKKHYHMLTEYDGNIVKGKEEIEDNIVTSDGDYAAHTRNLNRDSIGLAMCGMLDAKEYPFDPGPAPLTEKQFRNHAILNADMCRTYGIPVTRETVLFHAEVEPTLGVKQRGKWDVTRLPWNSSIVGALAVGDHFRELVREVLGEDAPALGRPVLKAGNTSPREDVRILQVDLNILGYHVGAEDGLFGRRVKAGVMSLQSDNGLITDGIVGPQTWAAIDRAKQVSLRTHTEASLRDAGSRTIATADSAETQTKVAAAGVTGLGALQVGRDALKEIGGAGDMLSQAQAVLMANWPLLLVVGIGGIAYFRGPQIMARIRSIRVADAVTGKHMGR